MKRGNVKGVMQNRRFDLDEGIAIGPILFVIAVLGILASAIAAGSGSFNSTTTKESVRAKAAALIDIGQTLKFGFDRLMAYETAFDDIVISTSDTSAAVDLFSPIGGGIGVPSVTMSETPASDIWYYALIAVPDVGTSAGSRVAILKIIEGVCDQINVKANSMAEGAADAAGDDLGDFTSETLNTVADWPVAWDGKPTGCVENTNATTSGFYFYQVIGIQ